MKKHLVILGGGIKGTATAAVATLFGDFHVTLLEADRIGSGTTATNHGRLHLGAAGWREDPPELIRRRRIASELVRQLPDGVVSRKEAIYCFVDEQEAGNFKTVMKTNGVPYRVTSDLPLSRHWIEPARYAQIIEVPEYSFNPARLAGRFAQTCANAGGRIRAGQPVTRISRRADKLIIEVATGDRLDADIVVNTMSRWCNAIDLPPEAPRPEINWFRWRFLCLHSGALPGYDPLDQVVVIMDRDRQTPNLNNSPARAKAAAGAV